MADRISELPDSILCNILSAFPTKFVATTSILSKRWKSVWLSTFNLEFDDETFKDMDSFTNFVSSTVSSRDTMIAPPPIRSLTFKCTNKSCPYDLKLLNQVVNLAIERGQLENLNLHMPYHSVRYLLQKVIGTKLVPSIFSCRTLQVLKLSNLILRDITYDHYQVDLPLLKTLHWYNVVFESFNYLHKFLSSCPVLQELQVDYLRNMMFDYYPIKEENFDGILPNLVKANINALNIPITLLSQTQNLRLQALGLTSYNELPMFHRLTDVDLILAIHPGLPQTSKLMWLLKLLQHCPKLQNLTIQDCEDKDQYEAMFDKYCKDQQIVPPCLTSQLKTFCLKDYKGTKNELQFVTYIIQNSKVLQTMTIKSTSFVVDIDAKHQMLTKLFSSTKGSRICKLLFD